jgi:hypothetical protein
LRATFALLFEPNYLRLQLNERHGFVYFGNGVEAAAIDVFVGEIGDEVFDGANAEFTRKRKCALGTNSWQIHYVGI